jgi:hypothetical protein
MILGQRLNARIWNGERILFMIFSKAEMENEKGGC